MTQFEDFSNASVDDEITVQALAKLTADLVRKAAAAKSSNLRALAEYALRSLAYELRHPSEVPTDLLEHNRNVNSRVVARAKFYRRRILRGSVA